MANTALQRDLLVRFRNARLPMYREGEQTKCEGKRSRENYTIIGF